MPTQHFDRKDIIDNIEKYDARDLLEAIREGVITFEELCAETEGYFPAPVRKELEALLSSGAALPEPESEPPFLKEAEPIITPEPVAAPSVAAPPPFPTGWFVEDWEAVDKSSDEALKRFIDSHPGHPMIQEANALRNAIYRASRTKHDINTLREEIVRLMTAKNVIDKDHKIFETVKKYLSLGHISQDDLLGAIAADNNFLGASVVKRLVDDAVIAYPDLEEIGIESCFVDCIEGHLQPKNFERSHRIERINKVSTEIYFWGIPSSGKTCALGGIMSTAKNGKVAARMIPDNNCQGYGYMTRLAQIFKEDGKVGTLPGGTSIYDIYEMGFDLEDRRGHLHPVTCIDLAGELVRCMYKYDAREPLSEDERATLETVTSLLVSNRTTNRKIHFFVIEYGGENRLYEGLGQAEYLNAALAYINRTRIFEKDTDGVFLLFTKVDKTHLKGTQLVDHLIEYTDRYYPDFYNGLVGICENFDINNGKVERIPFTLGNVCFQNFCRFESRASENVVRKIMERSKGFKKGKLQKILDRIKE